MHAQFMWSWSRFIEMEHMTLSTRDPDPLVRIVAEQGSLGVVANGGGSWGDLG